MSKKELKLVFKFRWTAALILLVGANLIPLLGIIYLDWDIATIFLLYWLETVIIGIVNVPKMWACEGSQGSKVFITIFFAFHFGLFSSGHLSFLKDFFHLDPVIPTLLAGGALTWTAASFFVSHLVSMKLNFFRKKEYEGRTPNEQMFFPYGRIVVMHFVIILGGFFIMAIDAPIVAAIFLVGLKTIMDISTHSLEHAGRPTHQF